jgi:hypothetical protein
MAVANFKPEAGICDKQGCGRECSRLVRDNFNKADNHVGFSDLFILWRWPFFSLKVESVTGRVVGKDVLGLYVKISINLTTLLVSVTFLFYGCGHFLA